MTSSVALVSHNAKAPIRKVQTQPHNREIENREQLEHVLDELRTRIGERLDAGVRVRRI